MAAGAFFRYGNGDIAKALKTTRNCGISLMGHVIAAWHRQLLENGYVIVPGVFGGAETVEILGQVENAIFQNQDGATLRAGGGAIYGARNLLDIWPDVKNVWRRPPLPQLLQTILGPNYGLVRVLYFDKPPERTWSLPWHKDWTIAVRDNRLPSQLFGKPTTKAGVPHVEAPQVLLENMVTLRIHLDDVTEENGPLLVLPGSHRMDSEATAKASPVSILVERGDVLLFRPLLDHCSRSSHEGTTRHRRLLHLEFSGRATLPDGYEWHDFVSGD
jgi:Phytanoyl-CoA dioxygenase (PhyH)